MNQNTYNVVVLKVVSAMIELKSHLEEGRGGGGRGIS